MTVEFDIELLRVSTPVSVEELSECLDSLCLAELQTEDLEALWQGFVAEIEMCKKCIVSLPDFPKVKSISHTFSQPGPFLKQLYFLIQTIYFRSDYEILMPIRTKRFAFLSS